VLASGCMPARTSCMIIKNVYRIYQTAVVFNTSELGFRTVLHHEGIRDCIHACRLLELKKYIWWCFETLTRCISM
jgi:hypothetical protein